MRAAILHLAFAGLAASVAYTSAFEDNAASLGVNRVLGYSANGTRRVEREGKPALMLKFQLEREVWERQKREDIRIVGLEPCLELFGVEPSTSSARPG
jgi:RimJ/RimL family protein N-acetyltransferase